MEFNLCSLLGLDIDAIAYRIAVGETDNDFKIQKRSTAVSIHDKYLNDLSATLIDTESQTNSLEANLE